MRGTRLQPEVITPTLQFGMLADRALIVLGKIEKRRPLTSNDQRALENTRQFLAMARRGGEVIANRNMRGYTFEAMSAYEAVVKAAPEHRQLSEREVSKANGFLDEMDSALECAQREGHPVAESSMTDLRGFLEAIVAWCLRTTAGSIERVSY